MSEETMQAADETQGPATGTKRPRRETTAEVVPTAASLVADLEAAEKRLLDARAVAESAEEALGNARATLGQFLCPEGAQAGEKFQVWVEGASGRRLLVVELTPGGSYRIGNWLPRGRRP